jgi:hypothetical protein
MADPDNDQHTPERYEDTRDPRNPPNSVVNREVRKTALRAYLLPLVALFVVAGLALLYWANRSPIVTEDPSQIGTTGDQRDIVGERGDDPDSPGGFDPAPRPGSTREEIERRGGGSEPQGPAAGLAGAPLNELGSMFDDDNPRAAIGRRIDVQDVNVVEAGGPNMFWIQDGNAKAAVIAPAGAPAVHAGSRVNVSGVVEAEGNGGARIRATRVQVR